MSSITNINSTDLITDSRANINDNFNNLNTDKMETSVLDTDTTLAANSDAKVATQKAVKAYVDAGGNVNASETTKGIVEEATDAEVTAGTATGATGAKLFVSPAKLATRLSSVPVTTIFQQSIPSVAHTSFFGFGAMNDGSAFYVVKDSNTTLQRYERDSLTNLYKKTHTVTMTSAINGTFGIVNIGAYIYVFRSSGNVVCRRYLASDLTGETSMTVPTLANTADEKQTAWTDGTDVYIVVNDSKTTSNRWTLSGTTFSAAGTATVTTGIFANTHSCSVFNGTDTYIIDNSISSTAITIRKITTIDGSVYSTTSVNMASISGVDDGAVGIPIGTTGLYIGKMSQNFNATVATSASINLFPITKP